MFNKLGFTILLMLFAYTNSYSQKEVYTLKLSKIANTLDGNFKCDSILDNRLFKSQLGVIQNKSAKRSYCIQLEGDFNSALKPHINNQILNATEEAIALQFLIQEFDILEEKKAHSEVGRCRIRIEFLSQKDSKLYSLGSFAAEKMTEGVEISNKHAILINNCLSEIFSDFIASENLTNAESQIEFSGIKEKQYDSSAIPLEGYYTSFTTLVNNKPIENFEANFFNSNPEAKVLKYRLKYKKKDKFKGMRVKFIYKNNALYLNSNIYSPNKYFIKAKHFGRYIYFEDKFSDPTATVLFGAAGAALSHTKKGIILDTTNGKIHFLDDKTMVELLAADPDIFAEYDKLIPNTAAKEIAILKVNKKYEVSEQ